MVTRDDVPATIQGEPPKWLRAESGDEDPGMLAWGPFMVERRGAVALGWMLRIEGPADGRQMFMYSIDGRRIELPLLGGPHLVAGRLEALCQTGLGKEAIVVRPVRDSDERYLIEAPGGSGALVDRVRDALGW